MELTVDVGDSVQALDKVGGIWLDAKVVDIDSVQKKALIRYRGWTSQWDEWQQIGLINEEVESLFASLGKNGIRAFYTRGCKERCIPGPSKFDPTVGQSLSVMLLEHYDYKQELSDALLSHLKREDRDHLVKGQSFIRTLELIVWTLYNQWTEKGLLRCPIQEKLFPRRQPPSSLPLSECRKLRKGDTVYFKSEQQIKNSLVRSNDPFVGCVALGNRSTVVYEDLLSTVSIQAPCVVSASPLRDELAEFCSDDSTFDPDWAFSNETQAEDSEDIMSPQSTTDKSRDERPVNRKRKHLTEITSTPVRQKRIRKEKGPQKKHKGIQIIGTGTGTISRCEVDVHYPPPQHRSLATTATTFDVETTTTTSAVTDITATDPDIETFTATSPATDIESTCPDIVTPVATATATDFESPTATDIATPSATTTATDTETLAAANTKSPTPTETSTASSQTTSTTVPDIADTVATNKDTQTCSDTDTSVLPSLHLSISEISTSSEQVTISADTLSNLLNRISSLETTVKTLSQAVDGMRSDIASIRQSKPSTTTERVLTNKKFWDLRPIDLPIPLTDSTIEEVQERSSQNIAATAAEATSNRCALAKEYLNRTFTLRELHKRNVWGKVLGGEQRLPFDKVKLEQLLDVCFQFYPTNRRHEDVREITTKLNDHNRQLWCKRFKNIVLPEFV